MKKRITIIAACMVIVGVSYAVLPLFGRSYIPTHDGEYHIIRIVEFAKMLGAGYVIPRWAPDMNSGYGIPIFNYHYPLPNYIGSFVRIFTNDAVYAFQMSMGLGYIALAAGALLWLSAMFGAVAALVGTTVAMFVPYLFVDLYVRGSIGEVWAIAFLFLALNFIEKKKYIWFAVALGFLILSHNILAMLFTAFIFFYLFIQDRRAILWMLGGLGLSAFFWLPAVLEQKFVVGLNTVNFREHFVAIHELLIPSWGTEFSGTGSVGNKISFQIGLAPILVMAGALWAFRREKSKPPKRLIMLFATVISLGVLLMLPMFTAFWEWVKPLQLMQYPWRLLSFVIPVAGFAAAYWVSKLKRQWLGLFVGLIAVFFAAAYARPVLYQPRNEAYYLSRANFTDGTSSMGNSFSTIWTGWKNSRSSSPATVKNGVLVEASPTKYLDKKFLVSMDKEGSVVVNTLYFPGWKAFVDGRETPIAYTGHGLIELAVPSGEHTIVVAFTDTLPRKAGNIVSLVSLAVLLFLGYTRRRK